MAEKDYDPAMHTAEHILNSVMDSRFGCGRSFRSHIEKKKSKCDYRLNIEPGEQFLRSIEEEVNRIINLNIFLTEELITRDEAEGRYFTGKLPPDAGSRIRIVKIDEYDACPCIGPHVKNTSEIGRFVITTAGMEEGILRIRFRLEKTKAAL
jgi:Ser-tRNA(Ala) deacylase AlaX